MTWQRRLRLLVAVFLAAFAIVLYFNFRRREPPPTAANLAPIDPKAIAETTPGTLTLAGGETIAFERALTYTDGRTVLQRVEVKMRDEKGRPVTITADQAEQRAPGGVKIGQLSLTGNLRATINDGLHVTTDTADYEADTGILRAPGRVEFEDARLKGSGVGATYDRSQELLRLLDQVHVTVAPDQRGQDAMQVTAGAAGLARRDHEVRLEQIVHIVRSDRIIDSAEATLHLSDDSSTLTSATLRGGARMMRPAEATKEGGTPSLMQAADMDLVYGKDGRTLQRAVLTGDALVEFTEEGAAGGRRIQATRLELELAADGTSVTRLIGRDGVSLELPAADDEPAVSIGARTLDARGQEGRGLQTAHFAGGAEFRESAATTKTAAAFERVARSTALDVTLLPKLAGVGSVRFQGNVTFTDGTWRATAPAARHDPGRGVLALARSDAGALPTVANDHVRVTADAIELTLAVQRIVADGRVQSLFRPAGGDRPAAGEGAPRLPALLDSTEPVYVTAAKLTYDGQGSVATYGGGGRLWQGDSVISGDTITLDEQRGNLTASGDVRCRLMLGETRAGANRSDGDSQELQYDDSARRVVYRGKAHVNGSQGDLHADRIELYLSEAGRELSRVEAYERVVVQFEGGFTGSGSRLTYFADTERYHLQGQPVTILEEKSQACRETTGAALTFTRSTDTIAVVGTDGNRTRTKPVPCAERRR
jgi:LPS export ABC transporter protein LptC/lipopolysaccharide transport protein LptA